MFKAALPGKHCRAGFSKANFMAPTTALSLLESLGGQRQARGQKAEEVQAAAADTNLLASPRKGHVGDCNLQKEMISNVHS